MSPRKVIVKKTPYKTSVCKRLEILRLQLSVDINTMAARLKVTPWTYRSYMREESLPSVDGAAQPAGTANVSLDWLLTGKGDMFYRDVEKETVRALEAERNAIKTKNASDFLLSELEEMKLLMQQVPLVRHMVMGYYQKVKVEQKEIIEQETQKTIHKTPQAPPQAIDKEPEPRTTDMQREPGPATVHKEQEAPPAAVPKETESPDTVNKDPVKGAPGVQKLFPKKRKNKRKK
ncbi:MAG: hypothetical protein GY765_22135 [bacterium]|nr:hypothetical protein [bacterium]